MTVSAGIEILSGERAGTRIEVSPGSTVRIGRIAPAEVLIPDDPLLSALHFSIQCLNGCTVRDLGSRFGTFVRGQRVSESPLADGDEILAGRSRFAVAVRSDKTEVTLAEAAPVVETVVEAAPVREAKQSRSRTAAVREFLSLATDPLFAILDAAREPTLPERLKDSGEEHQSLYDGDRGAELAPYGPWLVKLPADCALLEELVNDGWGESWGVYLTSRQPFPEVRKHLRRFLLAKLPDGRQVYFRYYDPRVLRTYLQTCNASELTGFFGPVARYYVESAQEDQLLAFSPHYKDWHRVPIAATMAS